jgi:hypothetical protein
MLIGQHHNRDTSLYLKGNIASSDLQINSLFEEGNPFGKIRFDVELDLVQPRGRKIAGIINAQINELEYRNYNYENIFISGKYKENEYEGSVQVNDPNGKLTIQGLFKNENEKSVFNFLANLTNFHPDKLLLTDKYENPDISLGINANFTGNNPDDFNGYIELKDFNFLTEKDSFSFNNLRVETFTDDETNKHIIVASSFLNGNMKGTYSFLTLIPNLFATIENYLPSLINSIAIKKPIEAINKFDLNITIDNTDNISQTLKLPFALLQKTDIRGHYNNTTDSLFVSIDAPLFKLGNILF